MLLVGLPISILYYCLVSNIHANPSIYVRTTKYFRNRLAVLGTITLLTTHLYMFPIPSALSHTTCFGVHKLLSVQKSCAIIYKAENSTPTTSVNLRHYV